MMQCVLADNCLQVLHGQKKSIGGFCLAWKSLAKVIGVGYPATMWYQEHLLKWLAMLKSTLFAKPIWIEEREDQVYLIWCLMRYLFYLYMHNSFRCVSYTGLLFTWNYWLIIIFNYRMKYRLIGISLWHPNVYFGSLERESEFWSHGRTGNILSGWLVSPLLAPHPWLSLTLSLGERLWIGKTGFRQYYLLRGEKVNEFL